MRQKRSTAVLVYFCVPLIFGYIVDQSTKWLVSHEMTLGQVIVITDWFRWYYTKNSGAAFSIGTSFTLVFTLIMLIVLCFIFYYVFFRVNQKWWALSLGLIAAGAAGNLTDRLFRSPGWGRGEVIDFISVGNFAIFNIADSCVCCGVGLAIILLLRNISPTPTKHAKNTSEH